MVGGGGGSYRAFNPSLVEAGGQLYMVAKLSNATMCPPKGAAGKHSLSIDFAARDSHTYLMHVRPHACETSSM